LPETATYSNRHTLTRRLALGSATALVISNMIGTGIFTTTGFLAGNLGRPFWVLAVWIGGGIVAVAGCLVYAELAVNLPRSGGEYVYLREAWGPGWGFLSGWVSFFAGFSAPIAAAALAFSAYLAYFFPSLAPGGTQAASAGLHLRGGELLAVAVIAAFGLVNIMGLSLAARLQNALTILKLAVLAGFVSLAVFTGKGAWSHFSLETPRVSTHPLAVEFALSLTFVMFAYSGWNAATYMTEEIQRPERTLPQALVAGTVIVAIVYIACNLVFIYALPLASLRGVVAVGSRVAYALFGNRGGDVFSAMMAAALLSCVSAMVMAGPRVYYAMAQDGCFFSSAASVDPRHSTPARAILAQTVAAAVMVITGTFEALIYYVGFMLVLFAALATAGAFRLRHRPGWRRLPATSFAWPLVPGIFIAASSGMLLSTVRLRPHESLLGIITVAGGAVLYRAKFRKQILLRAAAPDASERRLIG
jgi:APA family basic amino acid/polyamine antiporter